VKAKINKEGVWIEQLETGILHFLESERERERERETETERERERERKRERERCDALNPSHKP